MNKLITILEPQFFIGFWIGSLLSMVFFHTLFFGYWIDDSLVGQPLVDINYMEGVKYIRERSYFLIWF